MRDNGFFLNSKAFKVVHKFAVGYSDYPKRILLCVLARVLALCNEVHKVPNSQYWRHRFDLIY